jgi:hypothetical protein
MRRTRTEAYLGAALLGAALTVPATLWGRQPATETKPPPAAPAGKARLEELVTQALRDNPDLRVAAAKASEAEAELGRTRLQVLQKVVQAHQTLLAALATAEFRQKEYERIRQLADNKAVSSEIVAERERLLAAAKAAVAAAESELDYLLGKAPGGRKDVQGRAVEAGLRYLAAKQLQDEDRALRGLEELARAAAPAPGPVADRIRQALDKPVSVSVKEEPVSALLDKVRATVPELHIQLQPGAHLPGPVTVRLVNVPLGAALQLVEDLTPDYRFVVRDYGFLLGRPEQLPRGAFLLHDFWKGGGEKPKGDAADKNPPPENVEGLIKRTDPASGLVTITIGSDAGLSKGNTLEVFRLVPAPGANLYLGTIRIIEVTATQAVGRPVGRMSTPPQPGDRVASRVRE